MTFIPTQIPGRYEVIERAADQFREWMRVQFRLNRSDFPDVFTYLSKIASALGGNIRVSESPSPLEETGGSLMIEPGGGGFTIRLSPVTSVYRDNFTIAHELGHFVLHYPHKDSPKEVVRFARYGSNPVETQANRFAAALLMPRGEFLEKRREFNEDTSLLSAHFEVSSQAVDVRKEYIR